MFNVNYAPAAFESLFQAIGEEAFKLCESKYILTNVIYWNKKGKDKREQFVELCKKYNKVSLMDSGGFQLISGRLDKDKCCARNVFELQRWMADIGFILDYPLVETRTEIVDGVEQESMNIITDDVEVTKRIDFTRKNIQEVKGLDRQGMNFYFVVHGGLIRHYNQWINELYSLDNFDGITLKTKNLYQLICSFFSSCHLRPKKYHALGTSAIQTLIVLLYLLIKSKERGHEVELVTYDSTSPLQFGVYKRALNLSFYAIQGYRTYTSTSTLETLGCQCKVCEQLGDKAVKTFNENYAYIVLHNINVVDRFGRFLVSLGSDKNILIDFTRGRYKKLIKVFSIIDAIFDEIEKKNFCDIYNNLDISIRKFIESLVDLEEEESTCSLDTFL